MAPNDRRRHRRFTFEVEVAVFAGTASIPKPGHLMDLSAGGVSFRAPIEPAVGAGAFIDFVYQERWACQATGYVVRVLPFGAQRGVAIEFGFANDALRSFLHTLKQTPQALRPNLLAALDNVSVRIA